MTLLVRLGAGLALLAFVPPANAAHHGEFDDAPFLRIVQDSDGGALRIDRAGNSVTVWEGGLLMESYSPVEELEVVMLDGSGSELEIAFDDPLVGPLTLWLGDGDRSVLVSGDSPEVGGDLSVWGGAGQQAVSVQASQPLTSAGDFVLVGVNTFRSDSVPVVGGGDLDMTMDGETAPARLDLFYLDLEGDLTYRGSSEVDQVNLGYGEVDVRGKVTIDLGDGISALPVVQWAKLESSGAPGSPRVAGLVSVSAGNSSFGDLVEIGSDAVLVKGLRLALGEGTNDTSLLGSMGKVQYKGGSGSEQVTLGMSAPSAKLQLGDGTDVATLLNTLQLEKLSIDFGAGVDTYMIEVGTDVPDGAKIKNLP